MVTSDSSVREGFLSFFFFFVMFLEVQKKKKNLFQNRQRREGNGGETFHFLGTELYFSS